MSKIRKAVHALGIVLVPVAFLIMFFGANSIFESSNHQTQVCFTPGDNCQEMIIDKIRHAKHTIHVQAYHLTNAAIIDALLESKARDVDVWVIVDKAAVKEVTQIKLRIPVFVDYRPAIAHNKVMIFDNTSFITGSYNFTQAAQKRNAENALWEQDESNALRYEKNFQSRLKASVFADNYKGEPREKERATPRLEGLHQRAR